MQSHGDSGVQTHSVTGHYFVNFLYSCADGDKLNVHIPGQDTATATAAASAAERMELHSHWFRSKKKRQCESNVENGDQLPVER